MSWWTVPDVPPAEAVGVIYIIEPLFAGQNLIFVVAPSYFMGRIAIIPEQDIARDSGEIMIQKITQTYFQNNIQKYIPYEYWRMDAKSIEEGGSDGDMAIFTEVFAITMDEIKQAIDELPLLFDIDHCPPRYLRVIAELLNFPLEDVDSTAEQRKQLKDAINWYRSKGSRKAFIAILYAFGFYATMIPLWTEDYQFFTDTIPGVAKGNDPPNDYPLLVENGGTWYRSPHYGILLDSIVEDRSAFIRWGSTPENQIPIVNEYVNILPDGIETSFSGLIEFVPAVVSTFTGRAFVAGWPVTDIVDDGLGVLTGTDITGTIDYTTGAWTLDFVTAPSDGSVIQFSYSYDWTDLVEEIGYHRAFYQMLDQLSAADVVLNYQFDSDAFNYVYRRIEFLRPVFAVLEWIAFQVYMQEEYVVPEGEEPMMTANPVRDEKGWYLGYCDMDDLQYTRLDERLLGSNMRNLESPLIAGAPSVIDVVDEVAHTVSGSPSFISGTLANSWLFSDVTFTATIGASPVDITDIQDEEVVYVIVLPVTGEVISSDPNGILTSFEGEFVHQPTIGSFETLYADVGSGVEEITLLNDDEGNFTGTSTAGEVTGTVDEFGAVWTLEFPAPPVTGTDLVTDYTYNDWDRGEVIEGEISGIKTDFSGTLNQLPLTTGGVLAVQFDPGEVEAFSPPWSENYGGSGLDLSDDGHLWAVNQANNSIYEIETDTETVLQTWSAQPTLVFPWGICYNPNTDTLWISDATLGGGPNDDIHEFERDGTPTGRVFTPPWVSLPEFGFQGDAAFMPETGTIWVCVIPKGSSEDGALFEWNPETLVATGQSIPVNTGQIPGAQDHVSVRGVAYDPVDKMFYLNSWTSLFTGDPSGFIIQMDLDGYIVNYWHNLQGFSGAAYDPTTEALWTLDNNKQLLDSFSKWAIKSGIEEVDITDDGIGGLTGTDTYGNNITGTVDYGDGSWTLTFITSPMANSDLILRYTYPVAEGVLNAEGITGVIDYLDGSWWMDFQTGYEPDDATDVLADYSYSNEIPPTDRSGEMPRGSTELPFPHVRDPQEGYCHPPEELWIDWYWIQPEDYRLPLTRDGMNLYPPAGPVLYIDHADFPSRGFTKAASVADHANTFTRELGYSDRALSLLEVAQNPPASAENWENQGTAWENWTGPWENLGD